MAGGVESMSRAPYSFPKNATGAALFGNITAFDTALGWRYPNPIMEKMFPLEPMGETAENIAERWNISREEQDAFALHSQLKAANATAQHAEEIVPIVIPGRKGAETIIAADEQPRPDTTAEALAKLSPAFRKGGSVTAGNSSGLNDGAAAMLAAGADAVEQFKLKPIARFVACGVSGVDPRIMGIGPVKAVQMALQRANLAIGDVGLMELNEAFAAQSLACIRELGIDPAIVNINGGAIALGHPLGMSGARIVGSLVRSMRRQNVRYGVAALCIGVGQGLAAVFEKID
jgi:acetyl-CoA acetyltransferase family protein